MSLADTSAIYFPVERQGKHYNLVGIYHLADTDQAAPLALFLHGMPGSEKNHDLAAHLQAQGWHVLILHLSGTWGSGGHYNFAEHPADARAALDFALGPAAPRPIDPRKVVVLGYSMGCRAALMTAIEDDRPGAVVTLCGFSDFSEAMLEPSFFPHVQPFLAGTTAEGLRRDFAALAEGLQPYQAAAQIAPRPVLVVHGTEDEIAPFYHATNFKGPQVQVLAIEGANHTFASHRALLIQGVSQFLGAWLTERA